MPDITHVASGIGNSTFFTTTNNHTVNKPAEALPGMYMVVDLAGAVNGDSLDTTWTAPAGWTLIIGGWDSGAAASPKYAMYGKFIAAGDPSSWTWTAAANTNMLSHWRLFTGVSPILPFTAGIALAQGTAATTRPTGSFNPQGPGYLIYGTVDRNGSDASPPAADAASKLRSAQPSNVSLSTARSGMLSAFTASTRTFTGGVSTGTAVQLAAFLVPATWEWSRAWNSGGGNGTTIGSNNDVAIHEAFQRTAKNSPANLELDSDYAPKLTGFETELALLLTQPASAAVYGDIGIPVLIGQRVVYRFYAMLSTWGTGGLAFLELRNNVISQPNAGINPNGAIWRALVNNGATAVGNTWPYDNSKLNTWLRFEGEMMVHPTLGYNRFWMYDEHSTTPFFANDPGRTMAVDSDNQGVGQFFRIGWGGSSGGARNFWYRDMAFSTERGPDYFFGPTYSALPTRLEMLGDTQITKMAMGDDLVDREYLGDTLIFQR